MKFIYTWRAHEKIIQRTQKDHDCHIKEKNTLQASRSHTIHKNKLECSACHVKNSATCLNCHFERFLQTGERKGNFVPAVMKWAMLINYKGKVTLGNVQTLVYKGKKFAAYAPYHTHAVQKKGRECEECHGNESVQKIIKSGKIIMMDYKNGKIVHHEGVVPVVSNALEWVYLDKVGGRWVPLKTACDMVVQYVGYGEPLSKDQLDRMAVKYKSGRKEKKISASPINGYS